MSPSEPEREHKPDALERALAAAAGREAGGEPPPQGVLAYARALRAARLALRDAARCPQPVLRRAQALFGERGAARVLGLVFDSWRDAAPAMRGGGRARSLRYEDGEHTLDLRVTRPSSGDVLLQVAAQPAEPGLTAQVSLEGVKREPKFRLDDSGAGQIRLPRRARAVAIRIRTHERVIMQAAEVPLE